MISFKEKIILITGASRGVGAAVAECFAEAGAGGVVINYVSNRDAADETAEKVRSLGAEPLTVQADVSRRDQANFLVKQTIDRFGRLDVLVANAGIWPVADRTITEMDDEQWDETIRVNVNGVYYVCQEVARQMVDQGFGNIIIVSSTAGQRGEAGHSDYAASKGAVISFTKSLATELGRYDIRVNCIAPGWIDTDMAAIALRGNEESRKAITGLIPLGRVASARDVAGPVLFLASDLARHITGEVLNVNGGSVLCG